MTTFEKIQPIIAEALDVNPELITEELEMNGIDKWDSMGNIAIISALEEKLHIEIPIEDLFELNSVKALILEIEKLS